MATKCRFAGLADAMKLWLWLPLCLAVYSAAVAADDDDVELPGLNPVVRLAAGENGPLLLVDPDRRDWLGLETEALSAASHQPVHEAVAVVATVTWLQQQRDQLQSAMLAVESARAGLALAVDMHDRLRSLSQAGDSGVAIGKMQQAGAERSSRNRELQAATAKLQSLYNGLVRSFGPGVAAGVMVSPPPLWLQRLFTGDSSLLKLTLRPGQWLPNVDVVQLDLPDGGLATARVLFPDSEASPLGGQGWLAIADISLPAGMRLPARMLQAAAPLSGVVLPQSAVLWFGGVPWVYLETVPHSFTRVQIDMRSVVATDAGWFMSDGIAAGAVVVTRGAQLLLSEEKHGLIPDEDDRP